MVEDGYFKSLPLNPFASGDEDARSSVVAYGDADTTAADITTAAAAADPRRRRPGCSTLRTA
jgi:hypothetical protein